MQRSYNDFDLMRSVFGIADLFFSNQTVKTRANEFSPGCKKIKDMCNRVG